MMTLEELHAHYKAVRQRLDNPIPKKITPVLKLVEPEIPEIKIIEPEPIKELVIQIQPPAIPELPAHRILREVAEKHGLTIADIKSHMRVKRYVEARQEASYRMNTELQFSLKQIGRVIGKRDHTTILHAINRYKKNLDHGGEPWPRKSVSSENGEKA